MKLVLQGSRAGRRSGLPSWHRSHSRVRRSVASLSQPARSTGHALPDAAASCMPALCSAAHIVLDLPQRHELRGMIPPLKDCIPIRWRLRRGAVSLVSLLAATGCGDNIAATDGHVYVIAHADDDLLFANPALHANLRSGAPVATVVLTAGDAGAAPDFALRREAGLRAAYAYMVGVDDDWESASVIVKGHPVERFTLSARPDVTLTFFRLPDGNIGGGGFGRGSLYSLWTGRDSSLPRIDDAAVTYTVEDLIASLGALIHSAAPRTLHTLEDPDVLVQSFSIATDHSDHVVTARLVLEASLRSSSRHALALYTTYGIGRAPVNVSEADAVEKREAFKQYNAHYGCWDAVDTVACLNQYDDFGGFYGQFFQRMLVTPTVNALATSLRQGERCVSVGTMHSIELVACDDSATQSWTLTPEGWLKAATGECMVAGDGASPVRVARCEGGANQRWIYLSDGRLRTTDGRCLSGDDVSPVVAVAPCRSSETQRWCSAEATDCEATDQLDARVDNAKR